MLTNGIHYDVPRAEYDGIDRMHFSVLKHMKKSPQHMKAALLGEQEDKDAFVLGRAVGLATLEPKHFRTACVVYPGKVRRGAEWEKFCEASKGLEVLTAEQHRLAQAMAAAVHSSPCASRHLGAGRSEVTLLWTDKATGIELKSRLDFLSDSGGIVELKSTQDASPEGFGRAAWNFDYLAQAAMYRDAYFYASGKLLPYFFVPVEKSEPHAVAVYRLTEAACDVGRGQYQGWLAQLAECRRSGRWPAYAETEMDLDLPRWVRNQIEFSEAA